MRIRVLPTRRGSAAAVSVLAVAFALIPAASAHAEKATLRADRGAWFWSSNTDITFSSASAEDRQAPVSQGTASLNSGVYQNGRGLGARISPGHFAVSLKDGGSDMRGYIKFETDDIDFGAEVETFVATFKVALPTPEHTQAHAAKKNSFTPATQNDTNAIIVACLMRQPWGDAMGGGGGGDAPYSTFVDEHPSGTTVKTQQNEPPSDCSVSAKGVRSSDGTSWSFDLTEMAKLWLSGTVFNEGVALLPVAAGIHPTWTVEFHGPELTLIDGENDVVYISAAEAASAVIEYTAAAEELPPPPPSDAGTINFPSFGNPVPSFDPPTIPTDVLGGNVQKPATRPQATVPVGATNTSPAWVYALILLIVAGLSMLSRAIGHDSLGLAVLGAGNRVAAVLRGRRVNGGEHVDG